MSPRRNRDSPTPSLASECAPPPEPKEGAHSPAGEWGSQFRRLEKKLSNLPTLCTLPTGHNQLKEPKSYLLSSLLFFSSCVGCLRNALVLREILHFESVHSRCCP